MNDQDTRDRLSKLEQRFETLLTWTQDNAAKTRPANAQETLDRITRLEQRVDIIRDAQEVRAKNVRKCADNVYDRLDDLDTRVGNLLNQQKKGA